MKTKTQLRFIVTGLILFIFTTSLSAQIIFDKAYDQPVLNYGDAGEWDDGVVFTPAVIKDGDTLRMWYTGFDEDLWTSPLHGKIGYAWSTDGIAWHKHSQNPVLFAEFEWEGNSLFRCAVIKDADTFKMWYGADGPPSAIGYATSVDGKNWNKHPAPILLQGPPLEWDDDGNSPSSVIKEAEVYKMWYYGNRPGFPFEASMPQCGLATSPDGINWTKYDDPETQNAPYKYSDPVLKVGPAGSWDSHRAFEPLVLKQDTGGYFMMYTGLKAPVNTSTLQQTGYAYSTDGIHWEKDENNPTIKDDHSFVEWGRTIYSGSALHYDGNIHYWFACFHTPPYEARPQIGYAVGMINGIDEYQPGFLDCSNYPNPFSTYTTIEYKLQKPEKVTLSIYNHFGNQVDFLQQNQAQGKQQITWDASDQPAGMYFCVLKTESETQTTKMIKLK